MLAEKVAQMKIKIHLIILTLGMVYFTWFHYIIAQLHYQLSDYFEGSC